MLGAKKKKPRARRKWRVTVPDLSVRDPVQWPAGIRNIKRGYVHQRLAPGVVPDEAELRKHGSACKIFANRGVARRAGLVPRDEVSYVVAVPGVKTLFFYWPPSRLLKKLPVA